MRAEPIMTLVPVAAARPPALAPETRELLRGIDQDVGNVHALDELVRALVGSGVWDTIGRLAWARDAGDGLLLLWQPAE